MKFRKKPVVIEAYKWGYGNHKDEVVYIGDDAIPQWLINALDNKIIQPIELNEGEVPELIITTLEGKMICSKGDWIIKGINGEFYPCKPDIFEKTYEPVAISKTETTSVRSLSCWYCTEIEKHGVVAVKTVLDEAGRELDAYDTPYNYCPNCGRKLD